MITIRKGEEKLGFNSWDYPDGAVGVRLDTDNLRYLYAVGFWQTITARISSSRDLMELIMVTDALREWDCVPIHLVLPCLPYQRQDRRCVKGESFSLRAFSQIINGLNFERVTIFDPHSDVSAAVLNNVKIIDQITISGKFDKFNARLQPSLLADRPLLVSPDAGANKKIAALAGYLGHSMFVRADKLRDLSSGKIKEIVVVNPREDIEGRDCIIVDDLLDRGGTFVGLAKALKEKGAKTIELFITHGLFTAEIDSILNPLCEAGISHIWTTNSYRTDLDSLGKQNLITVLKLEEVFTL